MSKRIVAFDIAKGIGICLVVWGHTMSPVMSGNANMEKLYRIIYTFHMPLFFLISGFMSGKMLQSSSNLEGVLKQRFVRLIIPYLTWAVIYFPVKRILHEQVRFQQQAPWWSFFLGNNPCGQMWFLYVLFILSLITIYLVNKNTLKYWTIGAILLSIIAPIIPEKYSFPGISVSFTAYQVGFYFVGLSLIKYRERIFVQAMPAVFSCVSVILWVVLVLNGKEAWWLKTLVAVGFVYLIGFVSFKIEKHSIADTLAWFGRKSMEIYIIHAPVLIIGRMTLRPVLSKVPWIYSVVMTIIAIVMSLLIDLMVLRRMQVLRLIVLGEIGSEKHE